MVFLVRVDPYNWERVRDYEAGEVTKTVTRAPGPKSPRAVILNIRGEVLALGMMTRTSRPVSGFDEGVRISGVVVLEEPLKVLEHGTLKPATVEEIRELANLGDGELSPESSADLETDLRLHLGSLVDMGWAQPPADEPRPVQSRLSEDAQLLAIRAAGIDPRQHGISVQRESTEITLRRYLPAPHEATIMAEDMRVLPGWELVESQFDTMVYSAGDRRVSVMNVDSTRLEKATGADLIYFHYTYDALVGVQYKVMAKKRTPISPRLLDQMARMLGLQGSMAVDGADSSRDFRIGDLGSFYFKFADLSQMHVPGRLAGGMYVPVEYLARLHAEGSLTVPGLAREYATYDNVRRHLTNTDFVGLLEDGWVGSRGLGLEAALQLVLESVNRGSATTFAISESNIR